MTTTAHTSFAATTTRSSSTNNTITPKELVLIGGGHAHVHVLKELADPMGEYYHEIHDINVTCISKDIQTPYSGMLPGYISGHYTLDEIHVDLQKLLAKSKIKLLHASVVEIISNNNDKDDKNVSDKDEKVGRTGTGGGYVRIDDEKHPLIRYDCLSINVGSAPSSVISSSQIPSPSSSPSPSKSTSQRLSYTTRVIPVKPISQFSKYYESLKLRIQQRVERLAREREQQQNPSLSQPSNPPPQTPPQQEHTIAVVGGGAGGVELACSIQYKLQQIIEEEQRNHSGSQSSPQPPLVLKLTVMIVTRSHTILEEHNWLVQKLYQRVLSGRNIEVVYNTQVIDVVIEENNTSADSVTTNDDKVELIVKNTTTTTNAGTDDNTATRKIVVDDCLLCTSASGPAWLTTNTPFETTPGGGFVKVEDTYQVVDFPGVFACGDCSHMVTNPRPKAGVFAVRAGPYILKNVISYLTNPTQDALTKHVPQTTFLGILSTGDKYAIASKGSYFAVQGKWVWHWKDYIDRTWMEQYSTNTNTQTTKTNTNADADADAST